MENLYVPLMVAVFSFAIGCVLGETNGTEKAASLPWRVISQGANSRIEEATQEVFQSEDAWHEWWRRHNAVFEYVNGKTVEPEPPEVDFSKETVLAVTIGMRSTGGHAVAFANVDYEGDTLVATLRYTSPGPDDMVTMALTAPYAIIAVPKHEGPVRFDDK